MLFHLKVSRSRNQIVEPQILTKNDEQICSFVFLTIIFDIFPKTFIFTYKRQKKYQTHMFIQEHTVIWATRVHKL